MASRYWVGGAGTWDNSTTSNWSTSSGGSSGASVPGASDTAIFDNNSGSGTITTNYAVSITALTLGASGALFAGTLTLGASFTTSGAVTHYAGTLNTAGFACSWGSYTNNSSTSSRTLTLGSSTITLTTSTGFSNGSSTGITFTANTATMQTSTTSAGMAFGGVNTNGLSLIFSPTSGTCTVSNSGGTFAALTMSGAGGTLNCSNGFTVTGAVTLTAGTLSTQGNTMTWGSFTTTGLTTRTLTLGASAIAITGTGTPWNVVSVTGWTLTSGTSSITFSGNGVTFTGGSKTYATVTFTGTGTITITNNTVFGSLLYTPTAGTANILSFSNLATISTQFTVTGAAAPNRVLVQGNTFPGSAHTITSNGTNTFSYADIQDVTAGGTASWSLAASTGGLGDCGGNTGITFTGAQNNYYQAAGNANFSVAGNWYLATNGGGGAGRVPLPQDTGLFDANSGAHTYTNDCPRLSALTCTGFTGTLTLSVAGGQHIYGSVTWGSGMSFTGNTALILAGRGSGNTITSNGINYGQNITCHCYGGTYALQDNIQCVILTFQSGTFDATAATSLISGKYATATNASSVATAVKMGSATWNISNGVAGQTIWDFSSSTGLTVTPGTSTINVMTAANGSQTFATGGFTYAAFVWQDSTDAFNSTYVFMGAGSFSSFTVQSYSTHTRTITLPSSTTVTATTVTMTGATSSNQVVLNASSPGTAAILSATTVTATNVTVTDNTAAGTIPFYAAGVSALNTDVTNWTTPTPTGSEGTARPSTSTAGVTATATPSSSEGTARPATGAAGASATVIPSSSEAARPGVSSAGVIAVSTPNSSEGSAPPVTTSAGATVTASPSASEGSARPGSASAGVMMTVAISSEGFSVVPGASAGATATARPSASEGSARGPTGTAGASASGSASSTGVCVTWGASAGATARATPASSEGASAAVGVVFVVGQWIAAGSSGAVAAPTVISPTPATVWILGPFRDRWVTGPLSDRWNVGPFDDHWSVSPMARN